MVNYIFFNDASFHLAKLCKYLFYIRKWNQFIFTFLNIFKLILGSFYSENLELNNYRKSGCNTIHVCSFCDYSTAVSFHFKRHMLMHSGEKPFMCNVCNKSFSRKDYLKIHVITHTGYRPYCCQKCNKTFLTKQNLKLHVCQIQNE